MNPPLRRFLDAISVGEALVVGPLTLVPLRRFVGAARAEVALLSDDTARVVEVSERGLVDRLRVESLTPTPLLLIVGEVLRGAKQDRLVNASVMVPAGDERVVSVSCVERGRWAYTGQRHLTAAETTAPWGLRAPTTLGRRRGRHPRGGSDVCQQTVWSEVRRHLRHQGIRSDTENLMDAMDPVPWSAWAGWRPQDQDVGAVFFLGGRLVGLEAFGGPELWAAAHRRVLGGLWADGGAPRSPRGPVAASRAFLERLPGLALRVDPGAGIGVQLHGEAGPIRLAALVGPVGDRDDVIHLRVSRDHVRGPSARCLGVGVG